MKATLEPNQIKKPRKTQNGPLTAVTFDHLVKKTVKNNQKTVTTFQKAF